MDIDPLHPVIKYANGVAAERLLKQPGIVGTGIGYHDDGIIQTNYPGLTILVEKKLPLAALRSQEIIPKEIENIPTRVLEIGSIQAQSHRTGRFRPAPGSVSIGHYKITAGTFGGVVKDKVTETKYALSNNHVLANCNDAEIGDTIYQPGPIDGGSPRDYLGDLRRFVPIDFGEDETDLCPLAEFYTKVGNLLAKLFKSKQVISAKRVNVAAKNFVDAAIMMPVQDNLLSSIMDIGVIEGTARAFLGDKVEKAGRTTDYTQGIVTLIGAIINVGYGQGRTAVFYDQIVTSNMSAGGDSGSLGVIQNTQKAFGLLFAGSPQATIYNPIDKVLDALRIEF